MSLPVFASSSWSPCSVQSDYYPFETCLEGIDHRVTPAPALPADSATEIADNKTFRGQETMATHRGIDLVQAMTRRMIRAEEMDPRVAGIQRTIGAMSGTEIDVGMTRQMDEMEA